MIANPNAKIRPMINTPNNMINTGINPIVLNQQPQQPSINVINSNSNLPTTSVQPNIQYTPVQPGLPNSTAAMATNSVDDELC